MELGEPGDVDMLSCVCPVSINQYVLPRSSGSCLLNLLDSDGGKIGSMLSGKPFFSGMVGFSLFCRQIWC